MTARALFHIHTRHSKDGWITPEQIVRHAQGSGIGLVIVTDHNTLAGAEACARLSEGRSVLFPLSAEYKSTSGDMIATFLSGPVRTRDPQGIIEETHAQGGLVILPHPFKGSRFADDVFERVDAIEVFNARCSDDQNARAADLARELSKPGLVGADAHLARELGLAYNEFDATNPTDWRSAIMSGPRNTVTAKTTLRAIRQSQMVQAIRRGQPVRLAKNLIRWLQAGPHATP